MQTKINLIPGPVSVPDEVLQAFALNYGSPDLNKDFLELYNSCEKKLQTILGTKNQIIMQTGEGMLGLWGALKSCLKKGDRVLAICTGVFGFGIAGMAESLGADVRRFTTGYDQTIEDFSALETMVEDFKPLMITAVHCETPSGTLNPLSELARIKSRQNVKLLCVDTVASAGGCTVDVDQNQIDLSLNGSQKCLSAPPSMTFVSIADHVWDIIEEVNYQGYDAFKPFKDAQKNFYFPNTMYWHGVAALDTAAALILEEGLENVYQRHNEAMQFCHLKLREMGLQLYPAPGAICSPTVSAVKIPSSHTWDSLDKACREKGLALAGSYGPLDGKVFRIGHMGSQARMDILKAGLDVLARVI